ncbi:hypothetical protein J437_LFUL007426 [Ladona fulva]|uniref:PiggyBac transposable element-derived protein domain-containing protein n=1 Tax=Ladona fulva TaxID=123851 RepID=A0A8K0P0W8_LADFU|nr:hypothetical protein J437_LFUL007426 [Ladona fulva]
MLGIFILQGIVLKPDYTMYFSKRESIATPFFFKVFSEKRFHLQIKFLHFADNNSFNKDVHNRKIYKIESIAILYCSTSMKFPSVYSPDQAIVVDESLLLWKGRLSWKQYVPSKRSKFGVKFLCVIVVHKYNQNMGGVDKTDGLMNMYNIARNQPKKYYQKIFCHLMDMAMLNGYTIYKKNMGKLSRKEFLIMLAEILIERFRKDFQTSQGSPSKSPKPSHLTEKHFPDVVPPTTKSAQQSDVL